MVGIVISPSWVPSFGDSEDGAQFVTNQCWWVLCRGLPVLLDTRSVLLCVASKPVGRAKSHSGEATLKGCAKRAKRPIRWGHAKRAVAQMCDLYRL